MGKLFEGPGIVVLILVVLVLFGSKRLPDVARGVGRSLRIFKAETKGLREDGKSDDAGPADEHDAAEHVPPALPPGRNTATTPDSAAATDSRDQR